MGIPVLILGESGSGKSASMRNFFSNEIGLVNVIGKPLPFQGAFDMIKSDDYRKIKKYLKETDKNSIVIDDCQYLMANEFMRRCEDRGWDKFTEIGKEYWELIRYVSESLPYNRIVYFLSHLERDNNGNEKIKTIGKMLDDKITIEGMFTIVLKTFVKDGTYNFITQSNGSDTVKSPIGMFDTIIDNDLKFVNDRINEFWQLEIPFTDSREEAKIHDEKLASAASFTDDAETSTEIKEPVTVEEKAAPAAPKTRKTRKVRG